MTNTKTAAETVTTRWESFSGANKGTGRRLVREWSVGGRVNRFVVVAVEYSVRPAR